MTTTEITIRVLEGLVAVMGAVITYLINRINVVSRQLQNVSHKIERHDQQILNDREERYELKTMMKDMMVSIEEIKLALARQNFN